MTEQIKKHSGLCGFLQGLFIFAWLANLAGTDSYVSIYMLCALAGIFCVCDNLRNPRRFSGKTAVWAGVFSVLFSGATLLANYPLFEPVTALLNLFNLGCSLLGGFLVGLNVLLCLGDRLPLASGNGGKHPAFLFLLVFGTVAAVDLAYLLFAAYPGVLTTDSITTIRQILTGDYNNTMPF